MTKRIAFYSNIRMLGTVSGHLIGAILTALVVALTTGFLMWFRVCENRIIY